ncbi:sensor histidine kinase [Streptomyces sp. NPDC060184]|uniref:sensor histidine kinase n=1 Tax=Streptomyces sp. NPDC060184 TaxID=3347064 RepID=UPI0036671BC9
MPHEQGERWRTWTAGLSHSTDEPRAHPALAIQVNALQAMCRQVFGFRLAMIAIATPFAIGHTAAGAAMWLIGGAILVTFMGSYVLFRDWERFGPQLLRHRWILGVDVSLGALLLVTATPESTLAYVTVCTPLLAGLVYGWRGSAVFAALQIVIVLGVYNTVPRLRGEGDASVLLLPGFCVIAGAVGVTLRNLLLRFGTASQALTEARAKLAVSEAVESERTRLAREMHDSVAKTLHGLALAAEGLAGSAGRMDPLTIRSQAELVARSARRAAAESRELLTDLRRQSDLDDGIDVIAELQARTADFAERGAVTATFRPLNDLPVPPIPPAVARQLLTVVSEAMENAQRHADPTCLVVLAGVKGDVLRLSVYDDGRGLPDGTTLETLRKAGHFGLVGMVERAASIGARLRIGRGREARGTEVRLELPLVALDTTAGPERPQPHSSRPAPRPMHASESP